MADRGRQLVTVGQPECLSDLERLEEVEGVVEGLTAQVREVLRVERGEADEKTVVFNERAWTKALVQTQIITDLEAFLPEDRTDLFFSEYGEVLNSLRLVFDIVQSLRSRFISTNFGVEEKEVERLQSSMMEPLRAARATIAQSRKRMQQAEEN